MTSKELQQYKKVQSIAKETIEFLKSFIKEGLSAKEIKEAAEKFMNEKGVNSFWYYNIGAFVFVGEETTISISGRQYQVSDTKVLKNDLVTVDLSPELNGFWGDFARSFIVENGKVVEHENSKLPEIVEGIKAEKQLHKQFQNFINRDTSFEETYTKMNSLIEELGFENLDFNKNLGHSIVKHKDDRIYIEDGNKTTFKDVDLFTFEPHIKKKKGKYGFKHENIYYFEDSKLKAL
jgi:methionine aminopeptidase